MADDNKAEKRMLVREVRISETDENEPPKIVGHAAIFDEVVEIFPGFREQIATGAFRNALKRPDDVRALVDHDPSKILGRNSAGTLELREDKTGLYVEILPPDTNAGRDIMESVKRGDVTGMSFGFQTDKDTWERDDEKGDLRTVEDLHLMDVSVVTYPAYDQTDIAVRSHDAWKESQKPKEHPTANARAKVELARRK